MNGVQDKKARGRGKSAATAGRREKLREDLLTAASALVEAEGLAALRARALADRVGCAVGAIYSVFPDLDAIVLAVNGDTLAAMDAWMMARAATASGAEATLHSLGDSYLGYVSAHPQRAMALFTHTLASSSPMPDWYRAQRERLFARIEAPLGLLRPDLPPESRRRLARTLFSAVHGVVLLGREQRVRDISADDLQTELRQLLTIIVAGLAQAPGLSAVAGQPGAR